MQVSDLLTQYQNNLSSGSEVSTKTKGIEQLVETVKQLKTGNIFEGTVNSIRGTQVILGLSSGQNITARLDAGLSLSKGQSVFFQVKSNDGEQIRIKPISMGAGQGNPTLMQALDAASLAVSERNLNMVNAMMKEGMSIDSKSLQNMARQIGSVPGSQPETIVQMQKLQLPIDANSVEQFENYKADRRQVLSQVQDLVAALGESFLDDAVDTQTMVGQNNRLVAFFGDPSMQEAFATGEAVYAEEMLPAEGQSLWIWNTYPRGRGSSRRHWRIWMPMKPEHLAIVWIRGHLQTCKMYWDRCRLLSRNTPTFLRQRGSFYHRPRWMLFCRKSLFF